MVSLARRGASRGRREAQGARTVRDAVRCAGGAARAARDVISAHNAFPPSDLTVKPGGAAMAAAPPPALQLPAAPELAAALLPFQREGVAACIQAGGRLLLADEMGLGKTLQGLAVAAHYVAEWPVLIVVPSSLRWPWVDACERWLHLVLRPASALNVCLNGSNTRLCDNACRVHIITYPLLANEAIRRQLEAAHFRVIVCDECHMLKNPKAQRSAALLPLLERAARCVLLSGTPALSRPMDLYTQLQALAPGRFGSLSAFGQRYCGGTRRPWGWDYSGGSNLGELHARLTRERLMVRRLKADVLTQLPPKRREAVRLELGAAPAAEMATRRAAAAAAQAGGASSRETRFAAHSALHAWWAASGGAKAEAAAAYVLDALEGGAKLLVFAHHRAMLDALEAAVRNARVPYVRLDGSTPSRERHAAVAKFQSDAAVRCALLSMTACGQGITLTASSEVLMAELCWTPAVLLQAEDRAHRIGQPNAVNVRYLLAPGSVDDVMWPLLSRKLRRLGRALDGKAADMGCALADDDDAEAEGSVMEAAAAMLLGGATELQLGSAPGPARAAKEAHDAEDIRSFFGGGGNGVPRRTSAPTVIVLGDDDDAAPPPGWDCARCTLRNPRRAARCDACEAPRPLQTAPPQQPAAVIDAGDAPDAVGALDAGSGGDVALAFEVSEHTGRCFLYSGSAYLGQSFMLPELELLAAAEAQRDADGEDEAARLPPALRAPAALRQARRFAREWASLRAVTQRALCSQPLRPPLAKAAADAVAAAKRPRAAAEGAPDGAGGSRQRYSTMERFLAPSGDDSDSVREWSATDGRVVRQRFSAAGAPLCLHCGEAYADAVRALTASGCCGEACASALRVLTQAGAARRQLRALENGVCALCRLDTLALAEELNAIPGPRERARRLVAAGWGEKRADAAAEHQPVPEGLLWQADHAHAVAEGGGEADLAAFRTLCDPCHLRETHALRGRLAKAPLAAAARGAADIRTLFFRAPQASATQAPATQVVPARPVQPHEVIELD
jgi:hypothetical protein